MTEPMASYKKMEHILHKINSQYVTLKTEEVRYSNQLLRSILEEMVNIMKSEDALFRTIYERTYYGGSYYDDLKVGKPDEFDLDLLFRLPKCEIHNKRTCSCVQLKSSNKPGFFWFTIKQDYYPPLNKFIDEGYMQTDMVLKWLKGLVNKALNILKGYDKFYSSNVDIFYFSESGPALTLRLNGKFGNIDIDLVPAFKFTTEFWPDSPYRSNTSVNENDFFLVPKKAADITVCSERYWRASFQEQERKLIEGKERLKPAIRLLKKMRNNLGHAKVSSYALKTIVLWDVDSYDRRATLSDTFMILLYKYMESLNSRKILYYWNKKNNLLGNISGETITNHHNEITKKISLIERNCETDPLVIAKVILKENSDEYKLFIGEYCAENSLTNNFFRNLNINEQSSTASEDQSLATTSSSSGWATAGAVIVGLGALAAVGFGILGAATRNNRNGNN